MRMLNQKIAHTLTLCTTLLLIKPMMMMMMMTMIMVMMTMMMMMIVIMVMIPTLCQSLFSIKSMTMKPKFPRLENSRIGGQIVGNNKGGDFIMVQLFPISIGI